MFNYRLLNASGNTIGVVSLETEDLPNLLKAGEKLILSGEYSIEASGDYLAFMVTPEPVKPKSRIIADPDLMDPVMRMG